MTKQLSQEQEAELDGLKDLKLHVTDPRKSTIIIHGGESKMSFHVTGGAKQNEGLFALMMTALKKGVDDKIDELEQ